MAKIRSWQAAFKRTYTRLAFIVQYYGKKILFILKRRAPHFKRVHFNAFPAMHLRRMDVFDFAMKFSSELLVLALALGVAALNFHFFAFGTQHDFVFNDQSFAASFLANHKTLNSKLAEKNGAIITVVTASSFIARAQADDFTGLDPANQPQDSTTDNSGAFTADGIVAPSPDSIKSMVTNVTKKIYTTQSGDTLGSIASANGISTDSIRWSNPNLTSDNLQPGWDLVIPPVDGIAVTADANTTLPDLAVKYSPERYNNNKQVRDAAAAQLLNTIISYNGLDSAEDINDGAFLIIPGGVVTSPPAPPAPKPQPKPKTKPGNSGGSPDTVTSVSSGYDGNNHYFPTGYCTYYVASKMKITFGGNAKNWLANARASGYVTGAEPAVGAAVVFTGHGYGRYGHVAYVEAVEGGQIYISEMNYDHFNRVDSRWVSVNDPSIHGFIYP